MSISKRDLSKLTDQRYDIVIIGGGISGAWLALHCAQQGYATALLEKHDYASQTSSSSSKLLHGGIRYLQQMQFDKVRESAMERAEYLYAAPHLSAAVPFVVPTYKDFRRSKFFLNCGMLAYRMLCLGENRVIGSKEEELPPIGSLSAEQLNQVCDLSNHDHTGAIVFYERHMLDSERMVLAILQTARDLGAEVHNYVSAQKFTISTDNNSHPRVTGLQAKDELSGDTFSINSELVINAAGPWIDNLNTSLANADTAPSINGFAIGSHIITRQLCDHAIALTTKHQSNAKVDRGGRHIFVIPWRGYSLIGTSYDEIDSPNSDINIQTSHVEQLLEAVNDGMPSAKLTRDDLISGYSGLYPLQTDNADSTMYEGSGEYQIIDHATANGVDGLVTALGAKFTTGRKLSELTMKVVRDKLPLASAGDITRLKLKGSDYQSLRDFTLRKQQEYKDQFSADSITHLVMHYGSQIDEFINSLNEPGQAQALRQVICSSQRDIMGQVSWAINHEQAFTLNDVLFNRTSLGLLGIAESEIKEVATLMATKLGWSNEQRNAQIEQVLERVETTNLALRA